LPEEEDYFYIQLVSVKNDAKLNTEALNARVDVAASDYYRGLIEFTEDSRYKHRTSHIKVPVVGLLDVSSTI